MARIAGVDLPNNKRGVIGLTYIYGIGRSSAERILGTLDINPDIKVKDWNDEQIAAIRNKIANEFKIEGELRSATQLNIKDPAQYYGPGLPPARPGGHSANPRPC